MVRPLFILLLVAITALWPQPAAAAAAPKLNVIVILVDDLGAHDLGCTGSTYHRTPHLDQLARDGMKFTQAYAACTVCSPTRASLLTGQYPARLRITDWIAGHQRPHAKLRVPDWTRQLGTNVWNLAKSFRQAGYATASIGKWHLGDEASYPDRQGFDLNVAGTHRGQPPSYFSPYQIPTLPDGPEGEFLTDREAAEACRFIEASRDRPFFLYLPHYAVHTPLMGKPAVVAKYEASADPSAGQRHPTYAALLESVDDAVGTIRAKLTALNLAERTVLIFTGDNGGLVLGRTPPTSNAPLRSGKGSPYEGGTRVPLLIHWPGVTRPGSESAWPAITPDLTATVVELAGLTVPSGHPLDGRSLVPLLRGRRPPGRGAIYWHYPHYHPGGATPYGAVRRDGFKLIEYFEDGRLELFDLTNDPGETRNLAADQPRRARRLRTDLAEWRRRVAAQMPVPNPEHDPHNDPWK